MYDTLMQEVYPFGKKDIAFTGGLLRLFLHSFGVKLIGMAEKLLLMRSHFLSPSQIANLFQNATIHAEDSSAWVVMTKA